MNKPYLPNFSDEQMTKITSIVKEIEKLSDIEKLLLYLHLPGGTPSDTSIKTSKSKNSSDLFGKKADQEITQTYTWILSHLEEDSNVSLPKQEVYDEYREFCEAHRFEPLCVADFGKAMKHAFPRVKPRRLGQRGNSRYCYSGLRKKYTLQSPTLPSLIKPTFCIANECSQPVDQVINDFNGDPDHCRLVSADPTLEPFGGQFIKTEPLAEQELRQPQEQGQYSGSKGETMLSTNRPLDSSLTIANCSSQLPCTPDDDDYHHNYQFEMIHQQQQFNHLTANNVGERYNINNKITNNNAEKYDCQQANQDVISTINSNSGNNSDGAIVPCANNNDTNIDVIGSDQNICEDPDNMDFKQLRNGCTMKRSMFHAQADDINDLLIPTKKMYIKPRLIDRQILKNDTNTSEQYNEVPFSVNSEQSRVGQRRNLNQYRNGQYEAAHAPIEDGYRLAELRELLEKNLPHSQLQPQSIPPGRALGSSMASQPHRQQNMSPDCNQLDSNYQRLPTEGTSLPQNNMQIFSNSQMSPASVNESSGNIISHNMYQPVNSLLDNNSERFMSNNLPDQPLDHIRFMHQNCSEDDDVSLNPDQGTLPSGSQIFQATVHAQLLQDSPLNSTFSTPPERIPVDNTIAQQHISHITRCNQVDGSSLTSVDMMNHNMAAYRHQQEPEYDQAGDKDYQNLGNRHIINSNSYRPPIENNNYQRFHNCQHHSHHQSFCSPFVSPSSTPNPFTENYDQPDVYQIPMFDD